ncbi:uncharacterized protein F4812DRAFT_424207 [Daldinia caldariorum]|uniref:uncharacterized protein n=1 Tax=Daldinia caldariorum TaxID=326644 RepID=UPI0020077328|nr:uncharacterized protein F4812DRAFT_424207 [Daldinia caldariorum]KAI1468703.1 hypothetical protein F4812DRAFT_424207 [Daldinia caldariorum]
MFEYLLRSIWRHTLVIIVIIVIIITITILDMWKGESCVLIFYCPIVDMFAWVAGKRFSRLAI